MWTGFSLAPRRRYRDLIEHKILAVNGAKLMRWLWGEDQGGRISLYEPQREVVLSSLCLPLPERAATATPGLANVDQSAPC
jgi:hypothetical protein